MVENYRHDEPRGDPIQDYLTGQRNESQPALLAQFERESALAAQRSEARLDIPYGEHPRQTFDLFAPHPRAPLLAYFHAGYWQARDKSGFRFLAPPLVAAGLNVALVNYPLCPDVSLGALTEAVRAFPTALAAYARDRRETFGPWIAAGHSAGAHLAVELALTDWASRGAPADTVAGVVALSGVYDLAPLIRTPLNDNLKLTPESARAASPVFRVNAGAIPALFAVGAEETAAFRRQNQDMALAWSRAGHPAQTLVVEGADHFSLLRGVTHEASPLHQSILTCVSEAVRRSRANN